MKDQSLSVKVSVIIPNYNKSRFLKKRLTTILQQTFRDIEIIFVDDASTDDSCEVFLEYSSDQRMRPPIFSPVNQGIFPTWEIGIQQARGEYLWIAESDDYADERLLETLIACLDAHPNVGLAYCQSWVIDEHDTILSTYTEPHFRNWDVQRWNSDFLNYGRDECRQYLIYKNTIPNASAIVMRRALYYKVGGTDLTMKLNGDWLLWSKILLTSDIAYIAQPLNYFRTHSTTMRSVHAITGRNIEEVFSVIQYLCEQLSCSQTHIREILAWHLDNWIISSYYCRIPWDRQRRIYRVASNLMPGVWRLFSKRLIHFLFEKMILQTIACVRMRLQLNTHLKKLYNR